MKTLAKRMLWLLAAAGVTGLLLYALRPVPLRVETARVACAPLRVTIDAEGKTRVRDRFTVAAPVTGKLLRPSWRRGDAVARNAVLARLEPLPLAPLDPRQLAEARARVAAAEHLHQQANAGAEHTRADCEQAGRELTRAERLIESGDIARQEFERARNAAQTCRQELEAATFRARAAAAEVDVAKAALLAVEQAGASGPAAVVSVRAPASGRVLRVLEESERVVSAGTPLLELSNPTLEIVIDLLSADAVKVKPGAPVLIESWGGAEALQARVRLIEPSAFTKVSALGIEEQRVNVIADFVNDPQALGDGYRVEARIVIWEAKDVLQAPLSALFRVGADWHVFVVANGVAQRRAVGIGQRTALTAEVLQGLKEGDVLVTHPANDLAEGRHVEPAAP